MITGALLLTALEALAPFASSFVGYAGIDRFPHTVVGLGFKGRQFPMDKFHEEFQDWKARWHKPKGDSWKDTVNQFIPPILLRLDRRVTRLLKKWKQRDHGR